MTEVLYTFTPDVKEKDGRWFPIVWEQSGLSPRMGTLYELPMHSEEAARHMAIAMTIETRIMREEQVNSWVEQIKKHIE